MSGGSRVGQRRRAAWWRRGVEASPEALSDELAHVVRAAQFEDEPEPTPQVVPYWTNPTRQTEAAWRTTMEELADQQARELLLAKDENDRLAAEVADAEVGIAQLVRQLQQAEDGRAAAERETAQVAATAAEARELALATAAAAELREAELLERLRAADAARSAAEEGLASAETAIAGLDKREAELVERLRVAEDGWAAADEAAHELAAAAESREQVLGLQEEFERREGELLERLRSAEAQQVAIVPDEPREPVLVKKPEPTVAVRVERPAPPVPRPEPDDELRVFPGPRRTTVLLPVVAGVGALVAAGFALRLGLDGRLLTPAGVVATVVTVGLALVLVRSRGHSARVWIERGTVHVQRGPDHHRFDLGNPNTRLETVGEPGHRGWKLLFLRRGMSPFEIDARMVDPGEFTDAVRRWRPEL